MILSKVMHPADWAFLSPEVEEVDKVALYPEQNLYRRWEYAMALKALRTAFAEERPDGLCMTEFGSGPGSLGPLLFGLGYTITLRDHWTVPGHEAFLRAELMKASERLPVRHMNFWVIQDGQLGQPIATRPTYDAVFCISVLEHIRDYATAFRELIYYTRPGGLIFLTTDFAEDETDHYSHAGLRAGKMFTESTYRELYAIARGENCWLLGGGEDWKWRDACRLVYDYGFASMAFIRGESR
jgi:SAM-dependent methyltransferase